ncbi:class I SAM-dependent methyltransferase [Alloacidobacterium dinghuense]|uniref:Class I SAM-dependent methyltransferase n=1 Tax=Alloacidobacterium dinghuense TaxID=2763107 RepID=A0A7G8BIT9_9BACT|nr:class I SAM-dependent methyltransferase [Alloacidobacterium dinghuense]QNI32459.1 class I SAM-dependent methyltransferase [Alloacidobacterium dinghuense]
MSGRRQLCSNGGGALTVGFTGRVDSYRQFRPRYPEAVAALLEKECGLNSLSQIADVAAGTGLLAEVFLARGFQVVAVEPNTEMRSACETLVQEYPRFRCVDGAAEATGLPSYSFDLITVGQALHWFDLDRTRVEFSRTLRPGGWCAVIYNERRLGGDAFHDGYERLLREFGIDYETVQRQHLTPDRIHGFFAPSEMRRAAFSNAQLLTLEALEGRIVSSSYMPKPGHQRHAAMLTAIATLFESHADNGRVRLEYDCVVSYGQL